MESTKKKKPEEATYTITVKKELSEKVDVKDKDIEQYLKDNDIDYIPKSPLEVLRLLLPNKVKEYKCILREPVWEEYLGAMEAIRMPSGKTNIAKCGRFVLETCWLDGDEEIKTVPSLLYSASLDAYDLIEVHDTELKKN